ncbi:hypothetical protein [Aquimarina algicola]|uniref:hypothetical protein n=1 Tax=Aquimarina algicola TaxID=2589995 RepID=UPI001CF32E5D|nr:hypothetical protein [Aquimarina algicola]
MKALNTIITVIKIAAKYGAMIVTLVEVLNFAADKFEKLKTPNNESITSKV